jgi:undecaprenyl-diphosphatase
MAAIVVVVKYTVDRPPPVPVEGSESASFPSGHTAAALVCFGALALLLAHRRPDWQRQLLVGVAAVTPAVAAALVYANYHWLSDVVASIALGVALLVPLQLWLRARRA